MLREFEGAPKEEDLNKIEERVLELINKMKDWKRN
jgi:hypothetical protein